MVSYTRYVMLTIGLILPIAHLSDKQKGNGAQGSNPSFV